MWVQSLNGELGFCKQCSAAENKKELGDQNGELSVQFSSVQLLSCVRLFVTPWIAAHQASLSITNSQSFLKLISIESVMPSSHLILCHLLLLLPSIFPSIRVFSKESVLRISWPRYWSSVLPMTIQLSQLYFSSVLPMTIQDWFPLNWLGWSPAIQGSLKSLLQHYSSKASILQHLAFFKICSINRQVSLSAMTQCLQDLSSLTRVEPRP